MSLEGIESIVHGLSFYFIFVEQGSVKKPLMFHCQSSLLLINNIDKYIIANFT